MAEKQHAFQISINAQPGELVNAATEAAEAVNAYLETVDAAIGGDTQVAVGIGSGSDSIDDGNFIGIVDTNELDEIVEGDDEFDEDEDFDDGE